MNDETIVDDGQARVFEAESRKRGSNMETLVIVAALLGWFVLMRWVLPRMGVPT